MDNNELFHYGVLGMKWGVRRERRKSNKVGTKKKKNYTSKKTKAAEVKKKKRVKLKNMSDAELKERIQRLELEKKYLDLKTNVALSQTANGRKFAARVLEKSGESLAVQLANHYGAKGLNKLIGEEVIYANNKKKS